MYACGKGIEGAVEKGPASLERKDSEATQLAQARQPTISTDRAQTLNLARDVFVLDVDFEEPFKLSGVTKDRWEAGVAAQRENLEALEVRQKRFDIVLDQMQGPLVVSQEEFLKEKIKKRYPNEEFKAFLFGLYIPFHEANKRNESQFSTVFEVHFANADREPLYFIYASFRGVQNDEFKEVNYHRAFSQFNKIIVRYTTEVEIGDYILSEEKVLPLNGGVGLKAFEAIKARKEYAQAQMSYGRSKKVVYETGFAEGTKSSGSQFHEYVNSQLEGYKALSDKVSNAFSKGVINWQAKQEVDGLIKRVQGFFEQVVEKRRSLFPEIDQYEVFNIEFDSSLFGNRFTVPHAFGFLREGGKIVGFALIDLWTGQHYEKKLNPSFFLNGMSINRASALDAAKGLINARQSDEKDTPGYCAALEGAWQLLLEKNYYKEIDRSNPTFVTAENACWERPKDDNSSRHQLVPRELRGLVTSGAHTFFEFVTLTPLFESPYSSVEPDESWVGYYTFGALMGGMVPGAQRFYGHPAGLALAGLSAAGAISGKFQDGSLDLSENENANSGVKVAASMFSGVGISRVMHSARVLTPASAAVGTSIMADFAYDKYQRVDLGILVDPRLASAFETQLYDIIIKIEKGLEEVDRVSR